MTPAPIARPRSSTRSSPTTLAFATCARATATASASRCGGPRGVHGRRGRDHDGRPIRPPGGPRRLLPPAHGRLRLRVRLAVHARRDRRRTTRGSSSSSTGSSTSGSGCCSVTATTTRPTRSRPTAARSSTTVRPAAVAPFQPHRRAPAEGDRPWPLLRRSRRSAGPTARAVSPSCACRRWAGATPFIVLYVFFEHHLSRGDYRRPDASRAIARGRWRAGTPGARVVREERTREHQ